MAMASNIIQIRRKLSEQAAASAFKPGISKTHSLYGRDSGGGNAILELLLSTRLGDWLHIVQP